MNILKDYQIIKSTSYQKKSSDVMTPLDLAIEMVKDVPSELFGKRLLIPGSGYGTLAIAAVHCGWDPSMITCVEISGAYALVSSKRLGRYGIKVIHHDLLTWESQMQFDVVIANPPYSLPKVCSKRISNGKKNLALQFIEKAISLTKEGGYISMLTPPNFLKPTDNQSVTRSFSSLKGLTLTSITTGLGQKWFPGIKSAIILWSGIVGETKGNLKVNERDWDLSEIPFVVDLEGDQLDLFLKVWRNMKSGPNPVKCLRVGDGNKLPERGWSLTERPCRRKCFEGMWMSSPKFEKFEQIHISLDPEVANKLFQQPHVKFFMEVTNIEPTLYHNLLNGLDFGPMKLSKKEEQLIESYLSK